VTSDSDSPFGKKDIHAAKLEAPIKPFGVHENFFWRVSESIKTSDDVNAFVSYHEYAHTILFGNTSFGKICTLYSTLAQKFPSESDVYKQKYLYLIDNSEIAQEGFAVWYSMIPFMNNQDSTYAASLLNEFEEYHDYYEMTRRLLPGNLSGVLGNIAVIGSLIYCFQSKSILDHVILNFDSIDHSLINKYDFPDARFLYLIQNLNARELSDAMNTYIESLENVDIRKGLTDLLSGEFDINNTQTKGINEHAFLDLINVVVSFLADKFETELGPTIEISLHKQYNDDLIKLINRKIYLAGRSDVILNNRATFESADLEMLWAFEAEVIEFFPHEIKCSIVFPSMLGEDYWDEIFHYYKSDYHILIQGLQPAYIIDQYSFLYPEQKEWLEQREDVTCIRLTTKDSEGIYVVIIPFETPEELMVYLHEKPYDIPIFASIRLSLLFNKEWCKIWKPFLENNCSSVYYINDESFVNALTKYYVECKRVSYAYFSSGTIYKPIHCFVFESEDLDDEHLSVIIPCSEAVARIALNVIEKQFSNFGSDSNLEDKHLPDVSRILGHMIVEERHWNNA
jgi:hypothetical protein